MSDQFEHHPVNNRMFARILRWADVRDRPPNQVGLDWNRWAPIGAYAGRIEEAPIDPMTEQKLLSIQHALVQYQGNRHVILRLAGEWDPEMLQTTRLPGSGPNRGIVLPITTADVASLPSSMLGLSLRGVVSLDGDTVNEHAGRLTALYMSRRQSDWSIYA